MLSATPSTSAFKITASTRSPPSTLSSTKPSRLPSSTTSFKPYPPSTAVSLARTRSIPSSRASASSNASVTRSTSSNIWHVPTSEAAAPVRPPSTPS
ncbi:hypothetical protein AHAS_Ahas15G0344000 [Arachis hypogaea]